MRLSSRGGCHRGLSTVIVLATALAASSAPAQIDGFVRMRGTLTGRTASLEPTRSVCRTLDGMTQFVGRLLGDGTTIRFRACFPLNFGSPPAAGLVGLLVRNAVADVLWGRVAGDCHTSRTGVLRCRAS